MANTIFKLRRSSVAGKVPNTASLAIGELALNLTDRKLFSTDGSSVWETGANLTTLNVSTNTTVNNIVFTGGIYANASIGSPGQVLASNGSSMYWLTAGGLGTVTSVDSGNGLTGGPITAAGTLSVVAGNTIISNSSGVYVNTAQEFTWTNSHTFTNTVTVGTATYFVANGNVGIGTSTPAVKLQVDGSITSNGILTSNSLTFNFSSNNFPTGGAGVQFAFNNYDTSNTSASVILFRGLDDTSALRHSGAISVIKETGWSVANGYPAYMSFWTRPAGGDETERLRISSNGNIGIGNATPSYKLQVTGSFAATTKSFVIDHPSKPGMKLRYGSLEGPENGVYIRGRLTAQTFIEFPDYWKDLVDVDSITVQLTPIGKSKQPSVGDIRETGINVIGKNIDCFYHVFAERKDVEKLVVEF